MGGGFLAGIQGKMQSSQKTRHGPVVFSAGIYLPAILTGMISLPSQLSQSWETVNELDRNCV